MSGGRPVERLGVRPVERPGFTIDCLLAGSHTASSRETLNNSTENEVQYPRTTPRPYVTSGAALHSTNRNSSRIDEASNGASERLQINAFPLADTRRRDGIDPTSSQPEEARSNDERPVVQDAVESRECGVSDVIMPDDVKKRPRTAFSGEQVRCLEQEFQKNKYLSMTKRMQMSRQLGLTEQQIKIWFQNRRTKWKRKFTNNLEMFGHHPYLAFGCYPFHPPGFWQPSHLSIEPLAGVVRQPMLPQFIDTRFQQNSPPE